MKSFLKANQKFYTLAFHNFNFKILELRSLSYFDKERYF